MNTLSKSSFVFFILIFLWDNSSGANDKSLGSPCVWNYKKSVYQAGPQTWMIDAANSGFAYFANNEGLIEFDGKNWRSYPVFSGTLVRSVKVHESGRIYVGAFNEFGYFFPDEHGHLTFHPLLEMVPEIYREFGEIWKIYFLPQGVVFQSFEQIMIYADEKINVIRAPKKFHFSFVVNDDYYVNDEVEGLFRLAGERLVKIPGTDFLKGKLIWAMLPKGNDILIATADYGIFEYNGAALKEWKNPAECMLIEYQVYCAIPLDNSTYAFGTVQKGLLICDTAGNIVKHISRKDGLQNNTVLSLGLDSNENLWLGLDNGIDFVIINSPLTFLSYNNNLSAGYAAILFEEQLYLGTNQGVFVQSWDKLQKGKETSFIFIPGTQGQVWKLQEVDGELLCGHNFGTFKLAGNKAEKISDEQGGWTFLKPEGHENLLLEGTYSGLSVFEKSSGKWRFRNRIRGYQESSRYMVNGAKNELWISHGYKGVFRIRLNESLDSALHVDFYNSQRGFPTNFGINVFEFKGKPVFTTTSGIYEYDVQTNQFVYSNEINRLFGNLNPGVISEDIASNIWYFKQNTAGVLKRQEDGSYFDLNIPFRQLEGEFIQGFQFVYPVNNQHILFGTQEGFVHYLPQGSKDYRRKVSAFIRQIKILKADSVIYWGNVPPSGLSTGKISYKFNDMQFSYTANDYENPDKLQFSTMMKGYDEEWTSWDGRNSREFTNLRHGEYTFCVKARNIHGVETGIAAVKLLILPPWYLSVWAYIFYFLIFSIMVYAGYWFARHRLELAKRRENERQQRLFVEREKQLQNEALLAEKEVIRLRNEKLHAEMVQKDKELANATMQMIQKNKTLIKIKGEVMGITHETKDEQIQTHTLNLLKKINRDLDTEKQWQVFEMHFENVHEEFLKRLKDQFPDLSPRELKLCAYLKLNVSSKEIATLMNISTRGVEISRYRLRKKLNLDRNANLTDFIMTF